MNDQAKNWVWDHGELVTIICKKFFREDFTAAEDVAQDVLLKLSQKDGLDQVLDKEAWIVVSTHNECIDYFRKLKRHPDWKGESLEDPGMGADEKLSDAKLDKEARGSAEKIDPLHYCQSLLKYEPKKSEALDQTFFYVLEAFGQIRGTQHFLMDIERIRKVLAALRDIKGRSEKILSDIDIHWGLWDERHNFQPLSIFIQQQIRELVRRTEEDLAVARPNMVIDFGDPRFPAIMDPHFIRYYSRWPRCFIGPVPNEFYVLWGIWNRILKRKGKYGNRKLLKKLLLGYKKLYAGYKYIDTFNSLTEETNLETMRVMSYRLNKLNKGYSELADFIFDITINPPSCAGYKKIGNVWYLEFDMRRTPTDEKKPGPLPSI